MNKFLALVAFIPTFAIAATSISMGGRDVIRIEVDEESVPSNSVRGTGDIQAENLKLRRRVQRLEMAVRQLQDRTFSLETRPQVASAPANNFTCFIKTTFEGTMIGKGSSEVEAKGNALKECDAKNGGLSCKEENARCSTGG